MRQSIMRATAGLGLLLGITVLPGCGGRPAGGGPEAISVSADQLREDYQNESAGDGKYKGKWLSVSGKFDYLGSTLVFPRPLIMLGAGADGLVSIECVFDKKAEELRSLNLKKGDLITIKGKCLGKSSTFGANVALDSCEIVK